MPGYINYSIKESRGRDATTCNSHALLSRRRCSKTSIRSLDYQTPTRHALLGHHHQKQHLSNKYPAMLKQNGSSNRDVSGSLWLAF